MAGCKRCVVKKRTGKEEKKRKKRKRGWGSKALFYKSMRRVFSYAQGSCFWIYKVNCALSEYILPAIDFEQNFNGVSIK